MFAAQDGVTPTSVLYADDVFSTYLYQGTGASNTINNGIDLAGKGGMVWVKNRFRTPGRDHYLFDSVRGANLVLYPNLSIAAVNQGSVNSFTSTGFSTTSGDTDINLSGDSYASWTFREAPKFFDVVTYTGTGASQVLTHNLGVKPGLIIVKATSTTGNWPVWARETGDAAVYVTISSGYLNAATAPTRATSPDYINAMTSTTFNPYWITGGGISNTNGVSYVAYLFAHDTSSTGLIQCGSFTTDGSGNASVTSLGWEPQFLLVKAASTTGDWIMLDSMRGWNLTGSDALLRSNLASAETTTTDYGNPTATGFNFKGGSASATYVYMAIRRPNKPPTSGTSVFRANNSTSGGPDWIGGSIGTRPEFCDLAVLAGREGFSKNFTFADRLRGFQNSTTSLVDTSTTPSLITSSTAAETTTGNAIYQYAATSVNGVVYGTSGYATNKLTYSFRRAPGFFDIVYQTTGISVSVPHNLGVKPELYISKPTSSATGWLVHYDSVTVQTSFAGAGATGDGLNSSDPGVSNGSYTGTAATFTPNWGPTVTPVPRVVYLFATLPGISKVGTYTGNGTLQTIDCGFTAGPRFILIKRTDSTGDWYVWDTVRGILSASDPRLALNSTAAEVAGGNDIFYSNLGFQVNADTAGINVNAATYIYLAIA